MPVITQVIGDLPRFGLRDHRTGATLAFNQAIDSVQRTHHPLRRVAFERYEVDFQTGELRKDGIRIRLQAQPFRVLELLIERRGAVVTREELKKTLWPGNSFGDFDQGLNKTINKLREALADSALHPRYIETVARRGYRFVAVVVASDEPLTVVEPVIAPVLPPANNGSEAAAAKSPPRRLPITSASLAAGVVLLFVASLIWTVASRSQPSSIQSIAVLPLENLSGDVSQEYFADGMTDELITALGAFNELRVISRGSVMLYKRARRPLPQIARELKVDAVVEGTVLRSGEQVRITAQLIRAATDEHLWAESYQGDLRDTLQLQDKVARAIAIRVRSKVTLQDQTLLQSGKSINPAAYDAYLKGRYFWNKRTEQGLNKGIEYFDLAIARNPKYAEAYSGLADSYALLGDWEYGALAPEEAFPKAEAAATKALGLDYGLGAAHASLALCFKSFDWNWRGAERELLLAIKLSPSYATAHQWYGWNLVLLGRNEEGIGELKKAEALDPLSLIISADIADALLIAHRYDESIRQSRRTIEMDPSFAMAHYQMAQALVQTRQYEQAVVELREAIELSKGNPICTSLLAYVYALSGNGKDARRIVHELENGSKHGQYNAANIALIYAGLNEKARAFAWLERAYQARFNPSVLLRPAFDVLRSDPRFRDLWRRLGLS